MAYNLQSLINILEQMLHPHPHLPRILDPYKSREIESLLEKAISLREFFGSSSTGDDKFESLECRVRDAALEAEDALESHLLDRILSVRKSRSLRFFLSVLSFFNGSSIMLSPPGLQHIIREFDSVEEEIKKIMLNSSSSPVVADPSPNNILVGLARDSIRLKDRLTGHQTKLEIIPIIGMGGIGKTTLARNVYDDLLIVSHFEFRAWITISQHKRKDENTVKRILIGLLNCVNGRRTNDRLEENNDKLGYRLYRILFGSRYLIVLDDMWVTDDWDDIQKYFPRVENGSRIMVTTRETDVANYAAADSSSHHQMRLLEDDDSWELLCKMVFAQQTCPSNLEDVGRRIAKKCRGLPLAIHVIGGVLSQEERSNQTWEQVANDVSSIVAIQDKQFSKILSLSYAHLPSHLKPCFLYIGAFPEDDEIQRSRIIRLWVAEGFLKPISGKSSEEAADIYLKSLVDRNLIYVRKRAINGFVKSYGIHDLLRELCLRKACQEKFLHVMNRQISNLPDGLRRVCADSRDICSLEKETMTGARSILHTGNGLCKIFSVVSRLRLLKVLDILRMKLRSFPNELPDLINLRYLAISCNSHLSSSIASLRNLETIIFEYRGPLSTVCVVLCPSARVITAILDMRRLQHVEIKKAFYPCELGDRKGFVDIESLQSLTGIEINKDFVRVLKSVPNLKKLGCCGPLFSSENIDLSCLLKLETFICRSHFLLYPSLCFFIFPSSLKKLTLRNYELLPEHLSVIGELPKLQVLKLRHCRFGNSTWKPVEGGFAQVHVLLLEILNLENWVADRNNFPELKRLVFRYCSKLVEIPSGIGDIPTLGIIEVHKSSISAMNSARNIQEEQRLEYGNCDLEVRITC